MIKNISIYDLRPLPGGKQLADKDSPGWAAFVASIKRHGILYPLTVRPGKEHFEIIKGLNRWQAATDVGLLEVPCHIINATDQEALEIQIISPKHRVETR